MNPLRNPWVTGVLVVAAVGVVAYQVIQPRWQRASGNQSSGGGPAEPRPRQVATRATAPPEASPPDPTNFMPVAIEQAAIETRLRVWLESPARDPFFLATVKAPEAARQYLSPVSKWKLKAVWRQTGGDVAAINESIYAEGDRLEGYRVRRIENDGVWLEGPLGLERLEFPKHDPRAPTGNPPGRKP